MEEGADNSNSANGGSSGALGSDVVPEEGRIAGFDFLDPRKPGYLARSRFKPSLRTRLPRLEGSHYPRPVWPRFSLVRRYVPVSALTAGVYAFTMRFIMFWWHLACTETDTVLSWRTRIAAGVSLLGWFEIANVAFILWVLLDFVVALRDRRRSGLGQKAGYVGALVLLGALQFAYNRLDYAIDYLRMLIVLDDQSHPTLMLRIPPEDKPDANLPMTFEQCPVGLALLDRDPNWGNMHLCSFFEWETPGPNRFKRPVDPNLFPAIAMLAEMRRRATTARPPWLFVDMTYRRDLSWREVVEVCAKAFDAGFERVFLRDSRFRLRGWGGPKPPSPTSKSGVFYSVAEVLPVEPTRWRQGTGRENRGTGLVRVWAITEGCGPGSLVKQDFYSGFPPETDGRVKWFYMDHEGELSEAGLFQEFDR
jgi:hypothetical protein